MPLSARARSTLLAAGLVLALTPAPASADGLASGLLDGVDLPPIDLPPVAGLDVPPVDLPPVGPIDTPPVDLPPVGPVDPPPVDLPPVGPVDAPPVAVPPPKAPPGRAEAPVDGPRSSAPRVTAPGADAPASDAPGRPGARPGTSPPRRAAPGATRPADRRRARAAAPARRDRLAPRRRDASPVAVTAPPDPADLRTAVRRAADEGARPLVGDVLAAVRPAAATAGFPLLLLIAGAAFLLLQHRIDRRDPKLARPPLTADTGLPFGPPPEA